VDWTADARERESNQMSLRKAIRRIGLAVAATALVAVPVAVATSSPASASTVPYGYLQFCAQGSYPAYVHVLSEPLPTGGTSRSYWSTVVRPGQCWMSPVNTAGVWAQVDIGGLRSNGSEFWVGNSWYNSSVSGIGLGADGSEWNHWYWQW